MGAGDTDGVNTMNNKALSAVAIGSLVVGLGDACPGG